MIRPQVRAVRLRSIQFRKYMKSPPNVENSVMDFLVKGGSGARSLIGLLNHLKILQGVNVRIDLTGKAVWLYFRCEDRSPTEAERQNATARASQIMFSLVRLLGVLAELEKQNLVVFYISKRMDCSQLLLGSVTHPPSTIKLEICDPGITGMLAAFLCKDIVASPELHRLVRNGQFPSTGERRRQKYSRVWVAAAMVLSVLIGNTFLSFQRDGVLLTQLNAQTLLAQTQGQMWNTALGRILTSQMDSTTYQKETADQLGQLKHAVDELSRDLRQSRGLPERTARIH